MLAGSRCLSDSETSLFDGAAHTGECPRFEHRGHDLARLQCEAHGEARNTQGGGVLAPGLENVANAIAFAREQFLHGEQPSGPIRDEIFTSWRRSALSGANPDIATFPYSSELDLGGRLTKAAYPVLDRLAERLESTGTAVLLADKDARILNRWAAGSRAPADDGPIGLCARLLVDRGRLRNEWSRVGRRGAAADVRLRRRALRRTIHQLRVLRRSDHQPAHRPTRGGRDARLQQRRRQPADDAVRTGDVGRDRGPSPLVRDAARAGAARRVHQGRPQRAPAGHRRQRQDDHHQSACVTTTRGRRARHLVGVRSRGDLHA